MVLLLCSMAAGSFSRWNENSLKWENRPLKQKWPVVTLDNHTSVQTTMTSRPPIKRQQNRSHTNVTIAYPVARVINAIITWAEEADGANAYFYSLWANTNYSNVIWAVVIVVVLHVVTLPYSVSPPVVEIYVNQQQISVWNNPASRCAADPAVCYSCCSSVCLFLRCWPFRTVVKLVLN